MKKKINVCHTINQSHFGSQYFVFALHQLEALSKGNSCREQMATHPHSRPGSIHHHKALNGVVKLQEMKYFYTKSLHLLVV